MKPVKPKKCVFCEEQIILFGTHCPPCLILVQDAKKDYEAMLNEMRRDRFNQFKPRRLK